MKMSTAHIADALNYTGLDFQWRSADKHMIIFNHEAISSIIYSDLAENYMGLEI